MTIVDQLLTNLPYYGGNNYLSPVTQQQTTAWSQGSYVNTGYDQWNYAGYSGDRGNASEISGYVGLGLNLLGSLTGNDYQTRNTLMNLGNTALGVSYLSDQRDFYSANGSSYYYNAGEWNNGANVTQTTYLQPQWNQDGWNCWL